MNWFPLEATNTDVKLTSLSNSSFANTLGAINSLYVPTHRKSEEFFVLIKSKINSDKQHDCLFFFFAFLGRHPWHREVPRLGIQSKLAAGLHHSHSHTRPEPHLQTTPEFMAMPDP